LIGTGPHRKHFIGHGKTAFKAMKSTSNRPDTGS